MKAAGLLRVAALALIWGSGFLFIKISLRGFTPIQLTFARLGLGAIVLAAIVLASRRRLPAAGASGCTSSSPPSWPTRSPTPCSVSRSRPSPPTWPAPSTPPRPCGRFYSRSCSDAKSRCARPNGPGWSSASPVRCGSSPPWQADSAPIAGVLACLGASASYGVSYVYMGRYLTNRGLPPIVLSAAQLIAASALLALATPFGGLTPPTWRPDAILGLAILGVLGTGVAYVINYRIISDDGPVLASTVTYLLPVVAVVLGFAVLDETITVQLALGVLIVLAGVALTRRKRSSGWKNPKAAEQGSAGTPSIKRSRSVSLSQLSTDALIRVIISHRHETRREPSDGHP